MINAESTVFRACVSCGESVTVSPLGDGWSQWCPACREAWMRWWNDPNTAHRKGSRKLRFEHSSS